MLNVMQNVNLAIAIASLATMWIGMSIGWLLGPSWVGVWLIVGGFAGFGSSLVIAMVLSDRDRN